MTFSNTYLYVHGGEIWTYVQPGTILAITKAGIESAAPLHWCPLRIPTVVLNKDNCVFEASLGLGMQQIKCLFTYWVELSKRILDHRNIDILHANFLAIVCGGGSR